MASEQTDVCQFKKHLPWFTLRCQNNRCLKMLIQTLAEMESTRVLKIPFWCDQKRGCNIFWTTTNTSPFICFSPTPVWWKSPWLEYKGKSTLSNKHQEVHTGRESKLSSQTQPPTFWSTTDTCKPSPPPALPLLRLLPLQPLTAPASSVCSAQLLVSYWPRTEVNCFPLVGACCWKTTPHPQVILQTSDQQANTHCPT